MMRLNERLFVQLSPRRLELDTCELPFKNNVSMTIVLPHEHASLHDIESKLNPGAINAILNLKSNKQAEKSLVNLLLPDLKIRSNFNVKKENF